MTLFQRLESAAEGSRKLDGAAILNCGGAWRKLVPAFGRNE
jgi:hypothetical protein